MVHYDHEEVVGVGGTRWRRDMFGDGRANTTVSRAAKHHVLVIVAVLVETSSLFCFFHSDVVVGASLRKRKMKNYKNAKGFRELRVVGTLPAGQRLGAGCGVVHDGGRDAPDQRRARRWGRG